MGASCLRINPGNIGSKERVIEVINAAKTIIALFELSKCGIFWKKLLEKYKEPVQKR